MSEIFVTEELNHDLEGTWIVILEADKTPPHVLMVQDSKSWSLEHTGLHIRPVESLIKLIKRKRIKAVLFEVLNAEPTVQKAFDSFQNLGQQHTCLRPIRDFFMDSVDKDLAKCTFVFELIPELNRRGLIKSVKQLNLDTPNYVFPRYTKEQILKHISNLQTTRAV